MPDPAIKAALGEAVMQRCEAINDRCACREQGAPDRAACRDAILGMAEDCTAFLRVLPGHYITQGLDGLFTTTGWFAAAVEEAAKDG